MHLLMRTPTETIPRQCTAYILLHIINCEAGNADHGKKQSVAHNQLRAICIHGTDFYLPVVIFL